MVTVSQQHQHEQDDNRWNQWHEKDVERLSQRRVEAQPYREDVAVPDADACQEVQIGGGGEIEEYGGHDGSTLCSSDTDSSEETEDTEGWVADLPVPAPSGVVVQRVSNGPALPSVDVPTFGDVCVKNSTQVHLGNKTFYKGPVTIKQFVYANPALTTGNGVIGNGVIGNGPVSDDKPSDTAAGPAGSAVTGPSFSELTRCDKVKTWLSSRRWAVLICMMTLLIVIATIISVVVLRDNDDRPISTFPTIPDSSVNRDDLEINGVRFVERIEWGAQPPTEPLNKLELPVPYVIISHTASEFCKTQADCTFHVRFAQTFHIESRKWSDIAYNFLIGGDGLAYVGRSWDYEGAHSYGFNKQSIGISFIGTFNDVVPPKIQLKAAQKVIETGVKLGKIAPDYKLLGHRQISATLSPGDALFNVIKTWPNWASVP